MGCHCCPLSIAAFSRAGNTAGAAAMDGQSPGDFRGLGMSLEESAIFYSIGIGDGSWGAFYDVCCLYPLRTAIFGFSSQLQLVHGRVDSEGNPLPSPYLGAASIKDCNNLDFDPPRYLGLTALDECLLFMETKVDGLSFFDHCRQRGAGFLTDTSVTRLSKLENGQIRVTYDWNASSPTGKSERYEDFDAVIMTLPSWIIETHIQLRKTSARPCCRIPSSTLTRPLTGRPVARSTHPSRRASCRNKRSANHRDRQFYS